MKSNTFMAALIVFAALFAGSAVLHGNDEKEKEGPVVPHMKKINDAHKTLRRQARRMDFDDETVKLVIEMQTEALAAMHLPIEKADNLEPAAKKSMMLGYRKDMSTFIKSLLDLEVALIEDRKEDAQKIINDLGAQKNSSHEKYTDDAG